MNRATPFLERAQSLVSVATSQIGSIDFGSTRIQSDLEEKMSALGSAIIFGYSALTMYMVSQRVIQVLGAVPLVGSTLALAPNLIMQTCVIALFYFGMKAVLPTQMWYHKYYPRLPSTFRRLLPQVEMSYSDKRRQEFAETIQGLKTFDTLQPYVRERFQFALPAEQDIQQQQRQLIELALYKESFDEAKRARDNARLAYESLPDTTPEAQAQVRTLYARAYFRMVDAARRYLEMRLMVQFPAKRPLAKHAAFNTLDLNAWQHIDPVRTAEITFIKSGEKTITYSNFFDPNFDTLVNDLMNTLPNIS